jgi:hypothetical protein
LKVETRVALTFNLQPSTFNYEIGTVGAQVETPAPTMCLSVTHLSLSPWGVT